MGELYHKTKSGLKFHINNDGSISQSQVNFSTINSGDANALKAAGLAYLIGEGVEHNVSEAVKYFAQAALLGNKEAQYYLGCFYFDDVETRQKGIAYITMSAKQGYADAQTLLGYIYFDSYDYCVIVDEYIPADKGIEKNNTKAVMYFLQAAQQGNEKAQYGLGLCYLRGLGVKKDNNKALKYFTLAAQQGHEDATWELNNIHEQNGNTTKRVIGIVSLVITVLCIFLCISGSSKIWVYIGTVFALLTILLLENDIENFFDNLFEQHSRFKDYGSNKN